MKGRAGCVKARRCCYLWRCFGGVLFALLQELGSSDHRPSSLAGVLIRINCLLHRSFCWLIKWPWRLDIKCLSSLHFIPRSFQILSTSSVGYRFALGHWVHECNERDMKRLISAHKCPHLILSFPSKSVKGRAECAKARRYCYLWRCFGGVLFALPEELGSSDHRPSSLAGFHIRVNCLSHCSFCWLIKWSWRLDIKCLSSLHFIPRSFQILSTSSVGYRLNVAEETWRD